MIIRDLGVGDRVRDRSGTCSNSKMSPAEGWVTSIPHHIWLENQGPVFPTLLSRCPIINIWHLYASLVITDEPSAAPQGCLGQRHHKPSLSCYCCFLHTTGPGLRSSHFIPIPHAPSPGATLPPPANLLLIYPCQACATARTALINQSLLPPLYISFLYFLKHAVFYGKPVGLWPQRLTPPRGITGLYLSSSSALIGHGHLPFLHSFSVTDYLETSSEPSASC